MTVHQAIARALSDHGINTLFGLVGDANLYMVDAFRARGGRFVAAANEVGAAAMALGYAHASACVGVCSVTHGPALSNTVTALIEGVKASVPVLLLCGDTPAIDRENIQSIDQRAMIVATGAGFEQARCADSVLEDLAHALRRAVIERRPIALNLPIDLDWQEIDYRPVTLRIPERRAVVSESFDLDEAVGIIAAARRPIVLAGRGAASAEAGAALVRLAERIDAPLATTIRAKDLFTAHPANVGLFGTVSSPVAVEAISESDCIVAFGAGLNKYTTSHGAFLRGKRVVQVDGEAAGIGRFATPTIGVVGDPAKTAELIIRLLDMAEIESSGFATALRERALPMEAKPAAIVPDRIDFRLLLAHFDTALPIGRRLVTDGGRFMREVWKAIRVVQPHDFVTSTAFGSIGLGMAHAIGAACAGGDQTTVLFTGDGGFMNGGLAELNTAVRANLDLIVVVCNDAAYGAEHVRLRARDMDPAIAVFDWPEFAKVAVALGGDGITVRTPDDFAAMDAAVVARRRPLLIDVKLDPDAMPD